MNEKKHYVEDLDDVIAEYCENPGSNRLFSVLCGLFEGIENNCSVPCPAEMDPETGTFKVAFVRNLSGKESVVAYTRLNGEEQAVIADVKLRSLIRVMIESEACIGIVFNPNGGHEFYVPKQLLAYALSAGYRMALDDLKKEE